MNLYTKFCLLNWSHMQWSAIWTSLTWPSWTNQRLADILRLSPCVNVELIHAYCSDQMSMPPDLNMGVRETKTEPVTAQLAILPPPYLCQNCSYPWEAITVSTDRYTLLFPDPVMGNHDCLWVSTSITVPTLRNHYCSYSWVTLTVLIHG